MTGPTWKELQPELERRQRMTDSNGDLVEKVARFTTFCTTTDPGRLKAQIKEGQKAARAAIAAVLDDLASDAKVMALDRTLDLIDVKRKELNLK